MCIFRNLLILFIMLSAFSCCLTTEEEQNFFKSLDVGSHVFNDDKILLSAYGNLYLVDKDTMNRKYINNSHGYMASLSNNSEMIVFLKNEKSIVDYKERRRFFYEIWKMDIDGKNEALLKKPASFCSLPLFSQSDDRIYYIRMNEPQYEDSKINWTFDIYFIQLQDETLTEQRLTHLNCIYIHNLKLMATNELMIQTEKTSWADNIIYRYNLDQNTIAVEGNIAPFKYGQKQFIFNHSNTILYSLVMEDEGFTINLYKTDLDTYQSTKILSYDNDELELNLANLEISPDGDNFLFYLRATHDGSIAEKGYVKSHAFICNLSSGSTKKIFFEE